MRGLNVAVFLVVGSSGVSCGIFLPGLGAEGEGCLEQGYACEEGLSCVDGTCTVATAENIGVEWASLAGGSFQMGRASVDFTGNLDELPAHGVTLSSFDMTKTEITVLQYRACVGAGVCELPGLPDATTVTNATGLYANTPPDGCSYELNTRHNHPINCVTQTQARAFCEWLGGGLPSEAQWEYAARSQGQAASTGAGKIYPWGSDTSPCGSRATCNALAAVCNFSPVGDTAQGLCDMAGNVAEWTADCYANSYGMAPADGSAYDPEGCTDRVHRGGHFHTTTADLAFRTIARDQWPAAGAPDYIGIRCVR